MKILEARLHLVLWAYRQVPWRPSKIMWHPHKSFLKFGLLSSYAFGFLVLLTLQVVGPTFVLLIWSCMERLWFLSSGLCSLGQWLFAGCLLTGTGHCPFSCHEREAEQMGPLALMVLLHLCLANVNRWWWLLPWKMSTSWIYFPKLLFVIKEKASGVWKQKNC